MNWISPIRTDGDPPLPEPGLPRRLLRYLFEAGHVGIGSRVLDVGCGGGSLLRFLNELCLDATGLDESPQNIETARALAPELDLYCGRAQDPLPFAEQTFNVVLARDLSVYEGELFSYGALLSTARLLAAIRPGGHLMIVHQVQNPAPMGATMHQDVCFVRHLQTFTKDATCTRISTLWNWIPWRRSTVEYQVATVQAPVRARGLKEWLKIGRRVASEGLSCNCGTQPSALRRVA
jgi:SAM-dependent methyltransferase